MYDKVIINEIDYTTDQKALDGSYVVHGSIQYTDTIETSKYASFVLRQAFNYTEINKFMRIQIFRFNTKIFEGFVWSVASEINAASGIRDLKINCIGNEYIAKKSKPIGRTYTSTFYPFISDIVVDIYNLSLSAEGVNIGLIEGSGIETGYFTFNYLSPYDCFDLIAERTNMIWYIDENRNLFFVERDSIFANLSLKWDNRVINYETLKVTRMNDKYRNTQYAIGGRILTSTIEEIQRGDGSKTSFTMPYPLAELPKVYVDRGAGYIEETVGLKTDNLTGFKWFWSYASEELVQGSAEIKLLTSDLVKVEFKGLVNAVIISKNEGEILKKKNIDNTTGIVSSVEKVDIDGLKDIKKFNNERLDNYAIDSLEVEFETSRGGLRAGMTITGNDIKEEFLTEDLLISEIDCSQEGNVLIYKIKAVYGPLHDTWTDFYMRQSSRRYEEKISGQTIETVTQVYNYEKYWTPSESPNLFQQSLSIPFSVTATFGFSGFTRVRYLAWYNNLGVELGRTKVLIESLVNELDPIEITTIAFIPELVEAEIRYLGWIGGQVATIETGTGYILDQQAVVLNKTNLDIYQIEKTDYKW